ncbi:MAG: GntR family transcriptional regulator [Candidatus Nanopelagicales bacterium]
MSADSATAEPAVDPVSSQRIAAALREAILGGEFAPGERLLQDVIAERFGASRIPVREAFRILETEGLMEVSPNKGARVPALDLYEVHTYYRMRERLEPLTLTESLPHLTEAQIDAMERIQEQIEANDDVARFLVLDRDFHMTSYAACPSEQLLSATVRLWNSTQHYRRAFMLLAGPDRASIVNAEHRLLLDAIRRRDAEDAERFLEGHIRRTRVALQSHPELFTRP